MSASPDFCQQAVRNAERDFYLSALFAPQRHRPAVYAVYAFHCDLARIRDVAKEPIAGEIRLQWWSEVLQGGRDGEAAGHPIANALQSAIHDYALDTGNFLRQVDARDFDIYNEPMMSDTDLETYLNDVFGTTFTQVAAIISDGAAFDAGLVSKVARAYGYHDVLRRFGARCARGQSYIPASIIQRRGASYADAYSGRMTPAWSSVFGDLRARTRTTLDSAAELLATAPATIIPALLPAAIVGPALKLMERPNYDPFRSLGLPAWRRQWAIWRASKDLRRICR